MNDGELEGERIPSCNNKSCVTTKLWTNKQLYGQVSLSNSNMFKPRFWILYQATKRFIVLITWDIDILKEWIINYFTWVGNRGLENGKHLYFVFRTIILRLLFWFICIAYFHAENLDYCVYYFLKTSALIGVVLWHSWFFLNILKYIPNICHKNTWLIITLKVLKLRIGM